MMDLTAFTDYVKQTLRQLAGFTVLVTVCLLLTGEFTYITGWLAGCGINLIYFVMMSSRGLRALKLPPERAVYFIRGGAMLRLLMISLSLIVITQVPMIHFGAAAAGILSYRVLIFGREIWLQLRRVWRKEV